MWLGSQVHAGQREADHGIIILLPKVYSDVCSEMRPAGLCHRWVSLRLQPTGAVRSCCAPLTSHLVTVYLMTSILTYVHTENHTAYGKDHSTGYSGSGLRVPRIRVFFVLDPLRSIGMKNKMAHQIGPLRSASRHTASSPVHLVQTRMGPLLRPCYSQQLYSICSSGSVLGVPARSRLRHLSYHICSCFLWEHLECQCAYLTYIPRVWKETRPGGQALKSCSSAVQQRIQGRSAAGHRYLSMNARLSASSEHITKVSSVIWLGIDRATDSS